MICPKCQAVMRHRDLVSESINSGLSCWRCGAWVDASTDGWESESERLRTEAEYEEGNKVMYPCNKRGCKKAQVVKGFCSTHAREEGFGEDLEKILAKKRGRKTKVQPVPADVCAVAVAQADETLSPAPAAASTSTTADEVLVQGMMEEVDKGWQFTRKMWREDLRGAATVRSRAKIFLAMLEQLEAGGY